MSSIVDLIAEAEQSAAEIRDKASLHANEIAEAAESAAENTRLDAEKKAASTLSIRRENANRAARRLFSDVYNTRVQESKRILDLANTRFDSTVAMIVERVLGA